MTAEGDKRFEHKEKTWKSFTYTTVGTILPMLLATIPAILLREKNELWEFLDGGEVLLFGAGLYTSSLYLFGENKNSIKGKVDRLLSNSCMWMLIACSAFYATLYTIDILGPEFAKKMDISFVRGSSIFLFAFAVISVFRSTRIEMKKTYPPVDVIKKSESGVAGIMNQL